MTLTYRTPPVPPLADDHLRQWLVRVRDILAGADAGTQDNQAAIEALDTRVTTNEGDIATIDTTGHILGLLQDAVTETELFAALEARIDLIDTPVTGLVDRLTQAESDIVGAETAITALEVTVNDPGTGVVANATAITAIDGRVTTNETDIGANATAITAIDARLTTAESDVAQALADAAGAQATADGKVTTFFQTTAPTAEGTGDLWFDTDDGYRAYRWSGAAWVDIQDADIGQAISDAAGAQATADGKVTTFWQAIQPTADAVGDLWFDTDDDNHVYRWNGSSWEDARDGLTNAHAAAISTLQADVSTAEGNITANASAITTLQSDVGDNTAAISTEASTRATADGLLNAEYTVKLDVNGHVAGFGVAVSGGSSGPISSDFIVRANRFAIAFPGDTWQASTAYAVDGYVLPTVATGYQYRVTTAGTSGGTEPTWPTTPGQTVGDGSVVWTCEALTDVVPFVVGSIGGVPTVGIDGALVVEGTITTDAIQAGTLTGHTLQTSSSGQRVVVSGADNEIQVYADPGTGTVDLVGTFGRTSASGNDWFAIIGTPYANVDLSGIFIQTETGDGIWVSSDEGLPLRLSVNTNAIAAMTINGTGSGTPSGAAEAGSFITKAAGVGGLWRLFYKPKTTGTDWCQLNPSFYAKVAWNTTSPTLTKGYNVASTSNPSGNILRVTFTTALADADYIVVTTKSLDVDDILVDAQTTTYVELNINDASSQDVFVIGFGS